jgi:putative transposase
VKYRFMQEAGKEFPVGKMAKVLKVSVSGYYAYVHRKPSLRAEKNKRLVTLIRKIHQEGRSMYGSPRIYAKLQRLGDACSRKTVARLMRKHGIAAKMRKSWKRTTKAGKRKASDNLLKQNFRAETPNEKWASDITYIATREGWLYVSCTIDLFSRKVVGLSMGDRLSTELVEKTLQQAIRHRSPDKGLIHHSDRGCQYASADFAKMAGENGITLSMSGKGNCYDNAVMESFFHTLKTEHVYQHKFWTRDEAKRSIFEYILTLRKSRHFTYFL